MLYTGFRDEHDKEIYDSDIVKVQIWEGSDADYIEFEGVVEDTANGFIKAMQADATNGTVTNIGSGFEISIVDTANLIASLMGVTVEFVLDEERLRPEKSEVERLFASYDKAKQKSAD